MNEALDLAVLFVRPPIAEPPKHKKQTQRRKPQGSKVLAARLFRHGKTRRIGHNDRQCGECLVRCQASSPDDR